MVSSPFIIALVFLISIAEALVARGDLTSACSEIPLPSIPGAHVLSISAQARINVTLSGVGLSYCEVNVSHTHPGVDDYITTQVWLPLSGWNNRFQATGGGGWLAGYGAAALIAPVASGYVAASTDGGNLATDNEAVPINALTASGDVNWGLLADFSYRTLHEMAVVSKAVIASFYGTPPKFSYFTGCSNGGRQGYVLAQRYPDDFDGIMANAPGLYWPNLFLHLNWAHFLMNHLRSYPSACEYSAFQNASIQACDAIDGVTDGIISDPFHCSFDPYSIVGSTAQCGNQTVILSNTTAHIVERLHQGPRAASGQQLWDGHDWGFAYAIAGTVTTGSITVNSPLLVADSWVQYYLKKDPNFDFSTITTFEEYTELYAISYPEYGGIIGADNPDLSRFRDRGGKLLSWHGLIDQLLPVNQTLRYHSQVEGVLGGRAQVDDFFRLFLAPGVGHCGGGYGPIPFGLEELVAWVEEGTAPDQLLGSFVNDEGTNVTRNICAWPKVAVYKGTGDQHDADSFTCAESF